ncbi:glycosyltransferase family 1 protein [Laetiporus sulphureus 93-53]|uniref:UDP-N-acetylglucosamine transferase subunit ALG13 n=1 Tax=Laetiporus sulphureus 93-53 TaxID=1314785 RepID=A0A165FVM2_9APHY|nr:glycosyltransferase family 1 protein [Laetiporus sulphureus 93-53]KZT09468.1 glycosyltransferase family 1 protein [Laetiporus sulphureus 93-53]
MASESLSPAPASESVSIPESGAKSTASALLHTHVFVTVGSTRFDSLVQTVLSVQLLEALRARGYSELVVQCGDSEFDVGSFEQAGNELVQTNNGVNVHVWKFKPSLQEEYERADLVISHAGSGTILDVLRLGKPLIVVPNSRLLDNHQQELASALQSLGHLQATTTADLPQAIETLDVSSFVPFPQFNGSRFRELLDEEMGYDASDTEG